LNLARVGFCPFAFQIATSVALPLQSPEKILCGPGGALGASWSRQIS